MKKYISALLAGIGLAQAAAATPVVTSEDNWFVAQGKENGLPLIIRARKHIPDANVRKRFAWLTVISWRYSPEPSGMPERDEHRRMNDLEDSIESQLEKFGLCTQAVSRTGNGKKEWSYYIHDREEFMSAFNKAMKGMPRFPIEIHFYHDPDWKDLDDVLNAVKK